MRFWVPATVLAGTVMLVAVRANVRMAGIESTLDDLQDKEDLMSASFTHEGVTYTVEVPRTDGEGNPRPRAEMVSELLADVHELKVQLGMIE